jgi:hypothetical protein
VREVTRELAPTVMRWGGVSAWKFQAASAQAVELKLAQGGLK